MCCCENGLPVSPHKEFESAVESGDKPQVWTRGRNFERVQDTGRVKPGVCCIVRECRKMRK